MSHRELERQAELFKTGAVAANDFDRAGLTYERNARAIEEPTAQMSTPSSAAGPMRSLLRGEVAAAAVERAEWAVEAKIAGRPIASLVYDTLYRHGEFVAAAMPVLALLPPENLKVHFFVPEAAARARGMFDSRPAAPAAR